jgi:hypothetical protein
MLKLALMGALLALAGAAHSQTVIFDTFNEGAPENLYDSTNYVPVNSATGQTGTLAIAAIPFTAHADGKISEVDVALSAVNDPFGVGVQVQVMNSAGAYPFERKARFYNPNLQDLGQCCAFVADVPGKGVKIKQGKTYWIMVKSLGNADVGWNVNSMGLQGPYAVKVGASRNWALTEGPLPAVRVITQE